MIHLRKDMTRPLTGHYVTRPQVCARIAVTTLTIRVIVAKALCFVEGTP